MYIVGHYATIQKCLGKEVGSLYEPVAVIHINQKAVLPVATEQGQVIGNTLRRLAAYRVKSEYPCR